MSSPPPTPGDPELQKDLDEAELQLWMHIQGGQFERANATIARLLTTATIPAQRGRVEAALGIMLQRSGLTADAREQFRRALELVSGSPGDEATFLAVASLSNVLGGDLPGAEEQASRAIKLGEHTGVPFAVRQARTTMAIVHLGNGYPQLALEMARSATFLTSDGTGEAEFRSTAQVVLGMAYAELDRLPEAQEALTNGIQIAHEEGDTGQLAWFLASQAMLHFIDGSWEVACEESRLSLETASRTGALAPRPLAWGIAGCIEGLRGNTTAAWDLINAARNNRMGPNGGLGEEWVAMATAATTNDPFQRYDSLCEAWFRLRGIPFLLAWRVLAHALVTTAVDRGDHTLARVVTRQAQEGAERAGDVASARGTALCCQGSLEGSALLLQQGVDLLRGTGRPFQFAIACEDAARLHYDNGDHEQALVLLREASEVFHKLRATRWSATVGRSMSMVAEAVSHAPAPRPSGWERLTPAEQRVARLAAVGNTNPQIAAELVVSARTVQTHMAHICAKLGVSSRVQLAAYLSGGRLS